MKLYASDNSDLMEVNTIKAEKGTLVVEGIIMGAMPIRAVVKPAEVRRAIFMMSPGTIFSALMMLFRRWNGKIKNDKGPKKKVRRNTRFPPHKERYEHREGSCRIISCCRQITG